MQLTIETTLTVGEGTFPQAVHAMDNKFHVFYLAEDDTVHRYIADPVKGIYTGLTFTESGRASPDVDVSHPSLKRVAHYGAYGFWSANDDHRFVMFMFPTDISKTFVDGSTQSSIGSEVSSFSCDLLNIRGELLNRYRALVTPGTKLEVGFSIGNTDEVSLGVFYVDASSISYPDGKLSVSARNAIGKLLKEQTFDEDCEINEGSVHDNLEYILQLAEVENYFVGDPGTDEELYFDPDTTLLEGIQYAITNLAGWQIRETANGVVGVAHRDDVRFDARGVYDFARDRTCWTYNVDFDDANAASRVCVWSKQTAADPIYAYKQVAFNRWWEQPPHRTKYVQTIDDATQAECEAMAEELAESLGDSGRMETFAGIFTPQLVLGDEVKISDGSGSLESIGTVTDLTHNFGKGGFYTSFTVDSGGRRYRLTLKDLISDAAVAPQLFKGVQAVIEDGDGEEY